jgi:hypothetical protein
MKASTVLYDLEQILAKNIASPIVVIISVFYDFELR